MADITWITLDVALAIHEEQISEHGGGEGMRDRSLLESALARPLNLASYEAADLPALAAARGCGIARNHPFIDGNKRTALVAVETFLGLNGLDLTADDANCVLTMLSVATGEMSESEFALWLRAHTQARP